MKNFNFLAIDQGTHASRCIIYDRQGSELASAFRKVGLSRPGDGRVEQDAEELLDSIFATVREALSLLDEAQKRGIGAAGIATQRSSVLAVDEDGKPLSPVLSWQDVRAAEFVDSVEIRHSRIHQLSGLPASAHYGASKMRWLQQRYPQAERLVPLMSYFLYHLTGAGWVVDHANAQRTQLFSLASLDWSDELLHLYSIEKTCLPACRPVRHDYGELLDTGIPVRAATGDQNAAVFGAGDLAFKTALVNLGSGAFVLRRMRQRAPAAPLLTSVAESDGKRAGFLREGTVNGSGTALSWGEKTWGVSGIRENLGHWCAQYPDPPVFLNAVGGIGSPWWRRDLEPILIDSDAAPAEAKMVAVAESILFLINHNLTLMRAESPIARLRAAGGLSREDAVCQKLADLTGLPVERVDNAEATARGVAWLAAGRPKRWAIPAQELFKPRENPGLLQRDRVLFQQLESLILGSHALPQWVGHRGCMTTAPENTLTAIRSALKAGARHIEFDVQMSADDTLMVIHDANTQRTAGAKIEVMRSIAADLDQISVHYPQKFGQQFHPEYLPSLDEVLELLQAHPDVTAYVEIKKESLAHFGLQRVMGALIERLQTHKAPFYIISFDDEAIEYALEHSDMHVCWVLKKYDAASRARAFELSPHGLICNYKKIPAGESLWCGNWFWMLYDIVDLTHAMAYQQRGADLIETADIASMLTLANSTEAE